MAPVGFGAAGDREEVIRDTLDQREKHVPNTLAELDSDGSGLMSLQAKWGLGPLRVPIRANLFWWIPQIHRWALDSVPLVPESSQAPTRTIVSPTQSQLCLKVQRVCVLQSPRLLRSRSVIEVQARLDSV